MVVLQQHSRGPCSSCCREVGVHGRKNIKFKIYEKLKDRAKLKSTTKGTQDKMRLTRGKSSYSRYMNGFFPTRIGISSQDIAQSRAYSQNDKVEV